MLELLLKLMEQLNSSIFVLLLILVGAFWACYRLGGVITNFKIFKDDSKGIKDNIETIKESLSLKIDGVRENLSDKLSGIKATTDLLYEAHLKTVEKHSPVSLTELGKRLAKEIFAEEKINTYWREIKEKMEKNPLTNPYDVQKIAMEIADECFEKIFSIDEQEKIKTSAYKEGLNMLQIYPIIGIFIRDRYLKEKDMEVAEIDKYEPTIPIDS